MDLVTRIDLKEARFKSSIFETFASFAPPAAIEKSYGGRSSNAVRKTFVEASGNLQTFCDALRMVRSSFSTGCTETEVLFGALAVYMGKQSEMSYEAKGYPHSIWQNHFAIKDLRKLPMYPDEAMVHSMEIKKAQNDDEKDLNDDSGNLIPTQTSSFTKTTALDGATTTQSSVFGV